MSWLWKDSVAATMLRRPEPTKKRVESTTLGIAAIEFPHSTDITIAATNPTLYLANHHAKIPFDKERSFLPCTNTCRAHLIGTVLFRPGGGASSFECEEMYRSLSSDVSNKNLQRSCCKKCLSSLLRKNSNLVKLSRIAQWRGYDTIFLFSTIFAVQSKV